ncbi:MAG: c-type cytochrome [Haliea sp.]|nr:MAG: c-type cytochrome [Haliea sp.]
MRKPSTLLTIALTLAAVAGGGVLVVAAMVYGGLYNVASTRQHLQATFTVLQTAMRQSVRLRAREVQAPPLADEALVLKGAGCFRDKCVQCHGAPGVAQGDIGKSMQPVPGPLVDARKHWQARELYWVTRHGIKMSGMPAWEYRLSEDELWAVVAFMQRLPDLNAQQYAQLSRQAPQACGRERALEAASRPGDVERGKQALFQYACNACHTIPGVTSASPQVGPPLQGMAGRTLIGGVLANTPDNMVRWLRETQQVKPMTAMPQLDLAEQDARDIAAYLGTLH